jgi:hypothetical protein
MKPFWLTAFLDFGPDDFDRGVAYWEGVSGYRRSAPRGDRDEFTTLVADNGDDFLRVQRLEQGPGRIHLDVHVDNPAAAAHEARLLGAAVLEDHETYVVLSSPGGLVFCLVSRPGSVRPGPATWPGGLTSLVDQVCIDIPAAGHEHEVAFWRALTGWELRQSPVARGFSNLIRPPSVPIRLLMQRRDEGDGPVFAHLDLATIDRATETERHLALGAELVREFPVWTVLRDPVGTTYCLTDRNPETGLLP